ncbi:MAG: OmpA family protein [Acidobacteria bacterium]|nr:OmpA family protein [Acidobacteriota bacterium]
MKKTLIGLLLCGLVTIPVAAVFAQQNDKADQNQILKVSPGTKKKMTGVILSREADSLTLRDQTGGEYIIALTGSTKVEEKKGNPFRGSKKYAVTQLQQGLNVEVEGRGDSDGKLVAEKIRFKDDALVMATTVNTRVKPVEGRMTQSEERITQVESNAQRISGQIEELAAVSNAARGGAKAAQDTADAAVAGVEATNRRIDSLVSSLDDYEEKPVVFINFKVNSFKLSPEAMQTLDEVANQAKAQKAYLIEITGFASADGKADLNKKLSQNRAEAVVQYLADNHMIPLRRIITPHGYGTLNPVEDNATREGREKNRRVEVRLLVNKAVNAPPPPVEVRRPGSTGSGQ